jgi:arylsulfatase A
VRDVLCVLFVLVSTLTPDLSSQAAESPNFVVILVDDMGYGDVGCNNPNSKIPTPHIDGLAAAGMRMTDAHAAGTVCHPSRYGLLTGQCPFRTNVGAWAKQPVIREGQVTIASLLKSKGYHTAMVGKWHLGFAEKGYDKPLPGGPVDVGFDSYFGIRASTDIPPYFYIRGDRAVMPPTNRIEANSSPAWSPIQGAFWRAGGIAPDLDLAEVLPRFTDEAVKVLEGCGERKDGQPWMLYLAYSAPHTPWLPSKEFEGGSKAGMYGDFTMMVDAMVGRVLAEIEKTGEADNTMVLFSSDNGPVWYDIDRRKFGHDSVGGLRGMKGDAWEGGHRMPFIVRWPDKIKAGSVSDQVICFTDVLATFAAITGAKLPEDAVLDSFDISPVLFGAQPTDEPIRGPLAIPALGGAMTIRSGPWKLITGLGSGGFSLPRREDPVPGGPTGQLYNMVDDRGETTNLYHKHPEIVEQLTAALTQIRQGKPAEHVRRLPQ